MKIIKILTIILFFGTLLFATHGKALALDPYRHLCVGIQGKFYADPGWNGQPIEIGCSGDNGLATNDPAQRCTGQVITNVKPGDTFRLTKCSCFGSEKGCLKAGKNLTLLAPDSKGNRYISIVKDLKDTPKFLSGECYHNDLRPFCYSNGTVNKANIVISCRAPQSTPTTRPNTPTPTTRNTPTPLPSGAVCPVPGKVQNVKVTCPNCTTATSPVNTSALQVFDSPTPVPTQSLVTPIPTEVSTPTPTVAQSTP